MERLSAVAKCEQLVDPFSEQSLFDLQLQLSSSHPYAITVNMGWDDAGQLTLNDGIRIIEELAKQNESLARAMKNK